MPKLPSPKIKSRVEVKIQPSSDAKESVELDYRLLIAGDFSKREAGSQGSLKDRRLWEIKNKRDFKTTLENVSPHLKVAVPNKLVDDPNALMEVDLEFKDMKDFHPDEVCKRVEPLKDLMEARERLKVLRRTITTNPDIKKAFEDVLQKGGAGIDSLLARLSPDDKKADK
jgi:type VI secretion system protein ImpB